LSNISQLNGVCPDDVGPEQELVVWDKLRDLMDAANNVLAVRGLTGAAPVSFVHPSKCGYEVRNGNNWTGASVFCVTLTVLSGLGLMVGAIAIISKRAKTTLVR
jgi:hypothetical protein